MTTFAVLQSRSGHKPNLLAIQLAYFLKQAIKFLLNFIHTIISLIKSLLCICTNSSKPTVNTYNFAFHIHKFWS